MVASGGLRCIAARHSAELDYSFRLGPVTRLFNLPAPEESFGVQGDCQQYAEEIDEQGTRPRPQPVVPGRPLSAKAPGTEMPINLLSVP